MQPGIDYPGISLVFFCHDGKGNFLLSKRSQNCRDEHGTWDPGGGALEQGDKVDERLAQEIKEEYCAEILEQEFLGYMDIHREHKGVPTHWIGLFFKVKVDRSLVRNGEPKKFDEIGWFRLDDLPDPLHSQFPAALKKFGDKLEKI